MRTLHEIAAEGSAHVQTSEAAGLPVSHARLLALMLEFQSVAAAMLEPEPATVAAAAADPVPGDAPAGFPFIAGA